jgi:hypothetical protein
MSDTTTLIDQYLAAYGEPDMARRAEIVQRIWARGAQLIDPPLVATGHEQIVAQSDALLTQFPGHRFQRASVVDSHHGYARYAWQLLDPQGRVALEGMDVAEFDADERLARVVGFFGPLKAEQVAT